MEVRDRWMDGRMDGWQEVGEGGGSEMNEEALSLSLSRSLCVGVVRWRRSIFFAESTTESR